MILAELRRRSVQREFDTIVSVLRQSRDSWRQLMDRTDKLLEARELVEDFLASSTPELKQELTEKQALEIIQDVLARVKLK